MLMAKRKNVKGSRKNPWPERLYGFRVRHDLTQEGAAALAHVTRRAWLLWENGEKLPSDTYAHLLSLVIEKHDRENPR